MAEKLALIRSGYYSCLRPQIRCFMSFCVVGKLTRANDEAIINRLERVANEINVCSRRNGQPCPSGCGYIVLQTELQDALRQFAQ